jgi:UDP-N-acetylglucosamine 4,6-dehydratase
MIRILVTGAAGSVGKALVTELLKKGNKVCAFDSSEDGLFKLREHIRDQGLDANLRDFLGDIRELARLNLALNGCSEVYHCAALKHVGLCEYNPFEAVRTNIVGTNNIIEACIKNKVSKAILTSSDKAVNPTSMMGSSKLVAEKLFISGNNIVGYNQTKFGVVRFGNVWDTNGSVGRIFAHQVRQNLNLTVTDENMTRFFIDMKGALDLCQYAMKVVIGGEIFTRSMGATSIGNLAREFIRNYPNISYEIIGKKNGEKLYEELFTEVEASRTIKIDDTYITIPEPSNIGSELNVNINQKYKGYQYCKKPLRSDDPDILQIDPKDLFEKIKI